MNTDPSPDTLDYLAGTWDRWVIGPFAFFGLDDRPYVRAGLVAAVSAAGIYQYKPEALFYKGQPRPWSVLDPRNEAATLFPWWFVAGVTGALAYAII